MPAAPNANRVHAFDRIDDLQFRDSIESALQAVDHAGIDALIQRFLNDPDDPLTWHRRAVEQAMTAPRVRDMYFRIRRSLWRWPEFNALLPNARRILDAVVELARDEAFPWFVNVQADEILRLVSIDRKTFFDRLHDLECFTITRPARRIRLMNFNEHGSFVDRATRFETWPARDNNWCVDPHSPPEDFPQWVIRYRRGTPYNKRRAAWWINYDLLCETQRVLPSFEVCLDTLPKNYFDRNRRSGSWVGYQRDVEFKALERKLARDGPPPPIGLRAALWEGL